MTFLDQSYLQTSSWKPDLFKGKVVFVTGGAGSICRVQTEAMVLLGANAAIVGRNQQKTDDAAKDIESLRSGSKVVSLPNVDVRDVKQLAAAVAKTVKELGRIDYVIAGAAGNFLADFNHLSSNAFKSVIDIDLLGSFNTVKACFEELRKNKGAIIFVSATLHYYGVPFQLHVGAAKAGVDALSNALAVEFGPIGIRSNCIAPGPIADTEGMARLSGGEKGRIAEKVPLQRMGTKQDIADATVYLFSPSASYVTGDVLVVDGGAWQIGQGFGTQDYPVTFKKFFDAPKGGKL
ncbi:peroxisomal 2 4-dienoyl-CoA reductase sps19 [Lodderomyces elongisporus]|uniref:2,4-dienoyl-CoA reductase [(3E)-enoyl-CoA-producing] n=1 Tax=Lodderomyces elongisporus (strain ATCC 11503 / CBS 2605 / JCM 1781 / NBRC 1676 / NRRL YB-4239) TaxID=379508 RepID=A5DW99_LODEL|nr:peroxisomal 2 4-dienoyl-CoA reductase sps19 [Lodderomyces elongisporus]EDK43457.1 sporulation protein SPS19 [Lodderomyces elongisporus NRRL YB-4239]WLF77883.1 peroxisomal 2 4-dienoyl-CoA reductase sps19 [Lodderomyces elongisporus]